MERSFSNNAPRDTHAPQSIIYGNSRGKHPEADSVDMVGFELLREGHVWMHKPDGNNMLRLVGILCF